MVAKFKVISAGVARTVEADNFDSGFDRALNGAVLEGPLRFYRTVPASSSTQTVALFKTWESVELVDEKPA